MKKILDSKGNPIILNTLEKRSAENVGTMIKNAGYEVDTTTLTTILKKVVEQKFYEIPFADFVPVVVGEGAWSTNLIAYRSFSIGDDFATGIMNTGSNNSRMASADAMIDAVPLKVINWAKSIGWSLMDLQQASKSGNWDLVVSKEKARKKNWDLGLQKIAFLGLESDPTNVGGLLNQSDVTADTTTLTGFIKDLTSAQFADFCAKVYQAYRANSQYTAKPTHFVIPENDFNGLAAPYDPSFPIKTKLQALEEMFTILTGNKSFKIMPVSYAGKVINGVKNIYTMLNYDEETIRMNIPVNYTNTLANSTDNFNFQNVGYGQFTGVKAYRPREVIYFTHTV